MSNDRAVINSSPLITLCKSGQSPLLSQLFSEIIIPAAVWQEVIAGAPSDPAAQQLPKLSRARREDAVTDEPLVQAWDFGRGRDRRSQLRPDASRTRSSGG